MNAPEPRERRLVAIGMGSNLGDRITNLRFGRDRLRDLLEEARFSSVYETAPVHRADQPLFLNACCVGLTRLPPGEILSALLGFERRAGRQPSRGRYGPRPLDLDLLLYGGRVIDRTDLIVPHPRMRDRAFVLIPLAELIPDSTVPASGAAAAARVGELAARADATGVELTNLQWEPEV